MFRKKVGESVDRVVAHTVELASDTDKQLDRYGDELRKALETGAWRSVFPGKRLLEELAKALEITSQIGFVNTLIKEMAANQELIHPELSDLRTTILAGKSFPPR